MIPSKIKKFIESAKVKYDLLQHKLVYTAQDKAATLHLPPKIIGKTLVLKLDGKLALALIPADKNLDKNKFRKLTKAKKIEFATERVIKNKLKGVKIGAIPPFGSLWKLPTFVDSSLFKQTKFIVNSGRNDISFRLTPSTFKKIVPDVITGNFTKKK